MAAPFRLKTPLADDLLRVHSCVFREQLSELAETSLTLLSEQKDVQANQLLGKPVNLKIALSDEAPRHVAGYVTRFAQRGFEGRHTVYEMTLRPWLWLLTRTADCRIFQEMTVPDIVKSVFDDHPVARFEFKLLRPYRTWNYCVQYRETDYNFVARLLEQEGIYWYFTHDEGGHKLVLADAATAHDCAPDCESLPFYGGGAQTPPALAFVDHWSAVQSMTSGKVVITDFDFERPSASLETAQARSRDYDISDGEIFDFPGGYLQSSDGSQYAEDRLDELQAAHQHFEGSTNAQGVCTGHLLSLTRHPRDDQNARYLVTGASLQLQQAAHESGSGSSQLRCSFTAMPAGQQYRPARRTPKPWAPGPQTAIVTGPSGEEIFTDKYGRVKVQFHWDRRGQRNEKSSCWIRVSQPWAGKGWGGVSIPRIGQEVVVDFVEGDPDRPLITGRVYNAEQMPPFELPAGGVVSGIKSKSHKATGYNELSMDDTAGKEMITLHAQYDMQSTVEHDQTLVVHNNRTDTIDVDDSETVGNNQTQSVGVNQTITVGSNRSKTVGVDEKLTVIGHQVENIGATRTLSVGSSDSQTIGSTQTVTVTLAKAETIGAAYALTVGAAMNHAVGAALLQEVGGAKVVGVGGLSSETIGVSKTVSAGSNISHTAGANMSRKAGAKYSAEAGSTMSFQSGADYTVNSKAKVAIVAADELVLKCGSASLTLKSNGDIQLKGADINVIGSGKINVKASGDVNMKGSKVNQN